MAMPTLKIAHMEPELPVIQGGMGVGISLNNLASAVSNAGGIGIISGTGISPEQLREEIRLARKKSEGNGYIGVNCLYAMTDFADTMKAALDEGVDFIISGAGISRDMYQWGKAHDTPVLSIVSSAKLAKMSQRLGAAAVVVEGHEAGGHLGTDRSVKDILPEVAEAVTIPVIAAGGVMSGEDIREMISLGASGVQMGTRFVATEECDAADAFKEQYVKAEETSMMMSVVGLPGRAIENPFTSQIADGGKVKIDRCVSCLKKCSHQYCIYDALLKAKDGDMERGLIFSGAGVAKIKEILKVSDVMERLQTEYEQATVMA
ncbi:NAD(P)H-dependent flavin oxidoreductase [Salisediminibacterium selenitireducens]|uniref:Probable nitronate monooxygenase n=1 Tax=Bacillus selenitireducens (strain ATCC 700615 / DSM 15326 / MLS10) TaxID=439292 RepID=D6XZD0_BACIE|nr:nitronate monooxygenase [Salisediminibacterium selenitireducens]ADI00415.1 2-nitropropane dioxygenase NPD [[Bacillus] selenitireducens MLS10]